MGNINEKEFNSDIAEAIQDIKDAGKELEEVTKPKSVT